MVKIVATFKTLYMSTLKTERTHIGFFGRTNVGKSSIVNLISGQDTSIVSDIAGTTTDVVEKLMELSPLGAVVLIDTAGIDDISSIAEERKRKTDSVFHRCDFAWLVVEPNIWTEYEKKVIKKIKHFNIPYAIIVNKIDTANSINDFHDKLAYYTKNIIHLSVINSDKTEFIKTFANIISDNLIVNKSYNANEINMFEGLLEADDVCLFVTPIDAGSPKGRMILPQVQALRAVLDLNCICLFTQLANYQKALSKFKNPPKLVVTDSQVVKEVIELSFAEQNITTFSILLARLKGDFKVEIEGASTLDKISSNDIILIAEACSHHAQKDDIARVKFPALLEKYLGFKPQIDYCNGLDFPYDISKYKLIIHCGACMITHKEKLNRIKIAVDNNIPITNFGMALSFLNGYLERVLSFFN